MFISDLSSFLMTICYKNIDHTDYVDTEILVQMF